MTVNTYSVISHSAIHNFALLKRCSWYYLLSCPSKWKFALHYKVAIGRSSHNKMQALPCLSFCEMFMDEDDKRLEALTQEAFLIPYKCNNKFSIQTILSLQKLHNITLKNMQLGWVLHLRLQKWRWKRKTNKIILFRAFSFHLIIDWLSL